MDLLGLFVICCPIGAVSEVAWQYREKISDGLASGLNFRGKSEDLLRIFHFG